jgi:hypothetical protein
MQWRILRKLLQQVHVSQAPRNLSTTPEACSYRCQELSGIDVPRDFEAKGRVHTPDIYTGKFGSDNSDISTLSPTLTIVMMAQKGHVMRVQAPPTIAEHHCGIGKSL